MLANCISCLIHPQILPRHLHSPPTTPSATLSAQFAPLALLSPSTIRHSNVDTETRALSQVALLRRLLSCFRWIFVTRRSSSSNNNNNDSITRDRYHTLRSPTRETLHFPRSASQDRDRLTIVLRSNMTL